MRLFVAVDISDETRAQVKLVREQIEPLLKGRHPPRVTWVKDEAAHVTLRFIGETPDDRVSDVTSALAREFDVQAFDVQWDQLGTFPGGRAPRIVWIGSSRGATELGDLARLVGARLDPIVGPGEMRPFQAHVTIGRIKDPGKHIDWRTLLTHVRLDPTVTRVDHVTLYRSRVSPKGPTYTELCRTPLGT